MSKNVKMMILPWLLILGGIFSLSMFPVFIGGACMVLGIIMILETIWPVGS